MAVSAMFTCLHCKALTEVRDDQQALPPTGTISVFSVDLDDGLLSHLHQLHSEVQRLKKNTLNTTATTHWRFAPIVPENV